VNELFDAFRNNGGFTGAGTGDNEERSVTEIDGFLLFFVEAFFI